jgi:membrane protease subunit HflK
MDFDFRGSQDRRIRPDELPWDRILLAAPLVILVILAALLAYFSVYKVDAHERAVVMRFGKLREPVVGSGLHYRIPLVDEVVKVNVQLHRLRLPFGTERGRPRNAQEEETLMLTGDLNAAAVEWTIQWQVTEPEKFAFRFYQPDDPQYAETVIQTVAQTVMNRLVGDYSIDEVLTLKTDELEQEALGGTRAMLARYDFGVKVRDLQMQRVRPPGKVRPAFEQVNASIQKREQLEYEGKKERNSLVPQAEAEKDKLVREAEGYRDRRLAEAKGEIDALMAKYEEYKKAPEETRQRLYLEAMEEILAAVESKVIIDSELQGKTLPLLPLDQGANP